MENQIKIVLSIAEVEIVELSEFVKTKPLKTKLKTPI